jgi:hypothetical protein
VIGAWDDPRSIAKAYGYSSSILGDMPIRGELYSLGRKKTYFEMYGNKEIPETVPHSLRGQMSQERWELLRDEYTEAGYLWSGSEWVKDKGSPSRVPGQFSLEEYLVHRDAIESSILGAAQPSPGE